MNKYTLIKTVFMAIVAGFIFSCSNKDDYNWNKVAPGSQKITLLDEDSAKLVKDTIDGNNFSVNSCKAIARGGSKYNWVALGYPLSITQRQGQPFIIDVKAESPKDTFTWLKVIETTNGGELSNPDSTRIQIIGFCQYSLNDLLGSGNFTSKMDFYAPYKTKMSVITGDTLVNNNFFNMRWPVKYYLSKDYNQKVTIAPNQVFDYNGELVEVKGSGKYNTCKGLMVVKFAVCRKQGGDTLQYGSGVDSLMRK